MTVCFIVALVVIGLLMIALITADAENYHLRQQRDDARQAQLAAVLRAEAAERGITIARQRAQELGGPDDL